MKRLLVICAIAVLATGCSVFNGSRKSGRQGAERQATHQRAEQRHTARHPATGYGVGNPQARQQATSRTTSSAAERKTMRNRSQGTTPNPNHRAGAIYRANRRGMDKRTADRLMSGPRNVNGATERVNELLKSRNYMVLVDLMTTVDGHNRTLTHPWNIKVSGDKLDSYLPYVGQVYLPSVSTGEGLNFDGDIKAYSQTTNRKGEHLIKFWVRSGEDRYDYALTVYPGGGATLRVSPDRKSAVTFDGRLDLDKR